MDGPHARIGLRVDDLLQEPSQAAWTALIVGAQNASEKQLILLATFALACTVFGGVFLLVLLIVTMTHSCSRRSRCPAGVPAWSKTHSPSSACARFWRRRLPAILRR